MIDVLTQAHVEFGQLRVRSDFNNIAPTSGEVYLARVGAGGDSAYLKVGMLEAGDGTNANAYVFDGGRNNQISVDNAQIISGWKLTKPATKQTAEMVTVQKWANGRISEVKGDADLTVALGDPQVLYFGTPFTAPRTVTLPSDAEMLPGGLSYEIIVNGAVNGTNKLTVMSGTRTIIDLTTDSRRVKLVWQRNANGANGWVVTSAGPRTA
ncbi:hypothetical protein V1639_10720 [Pseudarthrobacter sp. J75]|uniref:hypothetical protein n=1 Tax=unclassified Pseudarthrobacter TaxID=2647000 RepID=UPI002E806317|nr:MULTISPECIES: hypothetical protein [unclassified Pseudarthrobacter]MEE2522634.1 hypothetical protein [Pseudarthrobacter sp. J47]MEE2529495.1 hypothetical protein [Pseudarthrobacter sp. J75]